MATETKRRRGGVRTYGTDWANGSDHRDHLWQALLIFFVPAILLPAIAITTAILMQNP
ncbi:hypothetical protein GCM10022240_22700 [Microbacterium kribbense]|uniref:Sugar ABC transporter permease n=1 Tax=Microbacterium kribbense TaxID=433645 RepID=A0ABP7GLA2_9MICO